MHAYYYCGCGECTWDASSNTLRMSVVYDTVMATGSNRFSPSPFVKPGHLIIIVAILVTALLVTTCSPVMCFSFYACIWFSRLPD